MHISLSEHNRIPYEAAVAMLSETGKTAKIHLTGTGKFLVGVKSGIGTYARNTKDKFQYSCA